LADNAILAHPVNPVYPRDTGISGIMSFITHADYAPMGQSRKLTPELPSQFPLIGDTIHGNFSL
jgi:hypothetical protein